MTSFYTDSICEQGSLALKSEFVSNDPNYGKKVLSSIEDGLRKYDHFYISVAFITLGGIDPYLSQITSLRNREREKTITRFYIF